VVLLIMFANLGGSTGGNVGQTQSITNPRLDIKPDLSARENRAIDHILTYTQFFRQGEPRKREVALTFDDGPGPYTPQILSILERHHVPATFFEIGLELQYFHASTSKQVAGDYVIGDHTETHPMMGDLSESLQKAEILDQAQEIEQYGAPFPRLYRPPYGSFDATTFSLLRRFHMLMVLWSADTEDYTQPGAQVIVQRVLEDAKPGAIILMHDAGGTRTQDIEALPEIIKKLRARHLKLVTIPRLALDDPPPRNQSQPTSLSGD